ncbi:succinate dehydrogenase assembly factor 4, mitochondrial [Scaptodrosophila lebanonensis]|uniref:Succinate dehydrogenase assembly factor 4, mitochondrial n=1 Tax=Drosophila lebanonensis TaxID=7225 RepID=A0A6J2TQD9_DROLE|nr:succinate dehydrogenase assembly factor 4, mitochondrial [Scaptodrosophila lebanonensis]
MNSFRYMCVESKVQVAAIAGRKVQETTPKDGSNKSGQKKTFQHTERYLKFKEKLRSEAPLSCLPENGLHPAAEKEPLERWPNNKNPYTGEIGGPAGPEPTRYGDWERKGRVTDF